MVRRTRTEEEEDSIYAAAIAAAAKNGISSRGASSLKKTPLYWEGFLACLKVCIYVCVYCICIYVHTA